jgi:hypothetical protein
MSSRWLLIVVSLVLCAGCTYTQPLPKSGMSTEQQYKDQLECQKIAKDNSWTIFPGYNNKWLEERLLRDCLEERGWVPQR